MFGEAWNRIVRGLRRAQAAEPDVTTQLKQAEARYLEGSFGKAIAQYRRVLVLEPNCVEALNNLAFLLATCSDERFRDGAEAVRLAEIALRLPRVEGMCVAGTLAAAYAEAGRFREAIATAEISLRDETAAGNERFAAANRQFLSRYRDGKPWHGTTAKRMSHYPLSEILD